MSNTDWGRPSSTGSVGIDRDRLAAATLVLAILVHGLAAAWLLGHRPSEIGSTGSGWSATTAGNPTRHAPTLPPSRPNPTAPAPGVVVPAPEVDVPVGLTIPAIGVNEPKLVRLGRNPDGSLQVPTDYTSAGWFTGGPTPGTPGPAVIAGHVDSKAGPGVFFRLRALRAHDMIIVRMSDGSQVRFTVDAVRDYPKSGFPTDLVYGPVPGAALRLITCGGSFDRAASSYRDNIVVYASLSVT